MTTDDECDLAVRAFVCAPDVISNDVTLATKFIAHRSSFITRSAARIPGAANAQFTTTSSVSTAHSRTS
jgi:hypothetical protein